MPSSCAAGTSPPYITLLRTDCHSSFDGEGVSHAGMPPHTCKHRFVFFMVPMINPDGIARGHFRSDTFGTNLNRMYLTPHPQRHPTIVAIKHVRCSGAVAAVSCGEWP